MPDIGRYVTYDAYRKRKVQDEQQQISEPLLPSLSITTPKRTLPNWLSSDTQAENTPLWLRASQTQTTPVQATNTPTYGGAGTQPTAEPTTTSEPRTFEWWKQPTEQEVQAWDAYKTTPSYQPGTLGNALKDTGQAIGAWWRNTFQKGNEQIPNNPISYGIQTAGTSIDALTGSIFGTLDSWTKSGMLTASEAAQFKQIYDSLDPSIHPQIRAAMAREALPRSTKQKILEIVDWTTQNMAKQLSGEYWGSLKGSIEGAKKGYQSGGIPGAIGGIFEGSEIPVYDAEGNQTGTMQASYPNYILNGTLRTLAGGPLLGSYGQGIDADIIRRAVTGENGGIIDPQLYQDIMQNREDWKSVQNAAPAAWQFVSEMATDPINVVSTAMGASASLMEKGAAAEGAKASARIMASAAQQGLTTADKLNDVKLYASLVGDSVRKASLAKQMTPGFRVLLGVSQAIDTAQNKGYLASLPGDSAVNMYIGQQTWMKYAPKALTYLGTKLSNAIIKPKVPDMPTVYRELGNMQYEQMVKDAADMGAKIPETTYYVDRPTNSLKKMNTRDYTIQLVQEAMTEPLNIDAGNGKVYPTLGDMVIDYAKRRDYSPEDFLDLTRPDLQGKQEEVKQYVRMVMEQPGAETTVPRILGAQEAKPSIVEEINAGIPNSVAGYRETPGTGQPAARLNPLDNLVERVAMREAGNAEYLGKPLSEVRASVERRVTNDILDSFDSIEAAQRWLDSNDATMEVQLLDGTPVSREAVQEAINRRAAETPAGARAETQSTEPSIRLGEYAQKDMGFGTEEGQLYQQALASPKEQPIITDAVMADSQRLAESLRPGDMIYSPTDEAIDGTRFFVMNADGSLDAIGEDGNTILFSRFKKDISRTIATGRIIRADPNSAQARRVAGTTFNPNSGYFEYPDRANYTPQRAAERAKAGEVIVGTPAEQPAKAGEVAGGTVEQVKPVEAQAETQATNVPAEQPSAPRVETTGEVKPVGISPDVSNVVKIPRTAGERQPGQWTEADLRLHGRSQDQIALNKNLEKEGIATLHSDGSIATIRMDTPEQMLRLLDSANDRILREVVDNPRATAEVLLKAANNPYYPEISHRAAWNDNADEAVFKAAQLKWQDGGIGIDAIRKQMPLLAKDVIERGWNKAEGDDPPLMPTGYVREGDWYYYKPELATESTEQHLDRIFGDKFTYGSLPGGARDEAELVALRKNPRLSAIPIPKTGNEGRGDVLRDLLQKYNRSIGEIERTRKETGNLPKATEAYLARLKNERATTREALDKYNVKSGAKQAIVEQPAAPKPETVSAKAEAQPAIEQAQEAPPATDTSPIKLSTGKEIPRAEYDAIWKPAENVELGDAATIERVGSGTGEQAGKTEYWPAHYALMDLNDLTASNMPYSGVVNPSYVSFLQPRNRQGDEVKRTQEQFTNPNYQETTRVVDYADNGVPIVSSNGTVVQGNGRAILLQMLNQDTGKWQAYQAELDNALNKVGLSPDAKARFENPVLVRVLDSGVTPDQVLSLAKVVSPTGRLDAVSQARVDADLFDTNELAGLAPRNTIEDTLNAPANDWIVTRMFGRMPASERLAFIDPSSGKLTTAGIDRVTNAWFIKTYGEKGKRLLTTFTTNEGIKSVRDALFTTLPDMLRAESEIAVGNKPQELSLYDDIISAVDGLLEVRRTGTSVNDYLAQLPMPGFETKAPLTPAQKNLLVIMDNIVKGRSVALRDVIRSYADKVQEWSSQQHMFENAPQPTAGKFLNDALIERGINMQDLLEKMPATVQETPKADTPADSVNVNYDKPAFSTNQNTEGTYEIVWNKVVNKDGKAAVKNRAVMAISSRDWLSMPDNIRRTYVKNSINNSAWSLADNKNALIDDIVKATDDWAKQYEDIIADVRTGNVPESVLTGGGGEQGAGQGGGSQPPRTPGAGTAAPSAQPPNQSSGNQLPNMPGVGAQPRPSRSSRRARTQANQQATIATAPGTAPAAAQGGGLLFAPQSRYMQEVEYLQSKAPQFVQNMGKGKVPNAIIKLTRGFMPEMGAFEIDQLAGYVNGHIKQQADGIAGNADRYLTAAFRRLEETGIRITGGKHGAPQMVEGVRLKDVANQPTTLNGAPAPEQLKHMTPNLNDVLSFPDWFEPTTTDATLAARQTSALQDITSLTERMINELENSAKSRGIAYDNVKTGAQYYIPRSLDKWGEYEVLKRPDSGEFREHLTATEGITRADNPLDYGDVQGAIVTRIRRIANNIADQETWLALHDIMRGRTLDELVDQDILANVGRQKGFLEDAEKVYDVVDDLASRVDNNYGTSPMTINPLVSWMNGELDPSVEFGQRVYELAHETDQATKQRMRKELRSDIGDVAQKYRQSLAEAQHNLDMERKHVTNLKVARKANFGFVGTPDEYIDVETLKHFTGNKTLYMERADAKTINNWFDPKDTEAAVIEQINNWNVVSRFLTQSWDLEMATRMASMAVLHPRVYLKSLASAFMDEGRMAEWMTSPEIANVIKTASKYGINLDNSAEVQDLVSDMRNKGLYTQISSTKMGKTLAGLASNAANVAQILAFKADWEHLQESGRKRAALMGDTSPANVQKMIDWEARGYFEAMQDHYGFRSMLGSGNSKAFRVMSRTLFMSGRKTIGTVNAQFNLFRSGAKGEMARKLLLGDAITLSAAGIATFALNAIVNDKDLEDTDTWTDFLDPHSSEFLKANIGGIRIGPGGTTLTLFNYYARLEDAIAKGDAQKFAEELPNWWLGRLSPALNLARTGFTGKNYAGVKLDTPKEWAYEVLGSFIPMSAQGLVMPDVFSQNEVARKQVGGTGINIAGKVAGVVADWLGARSTPDSPWMLLDKARNAAAMEAKGVKWDALDIVDKWTLTEAIPDLKLLDNLAVEQAADKDSPLAMFELACNEQYDMLAAQAADYAEYFRAGQAPDGTPYTGKNYREDMRSLEAARARLPAIIKAANPVFKDVPVTAAEKDAYYAKLEKKANPVDTFIDAWYQCSQDALIEGTTDQVDFDKLFDARDKLIAKTPQMVVAKAMPYINRNKDSSLVLASNLYKQYMALPKYQGLNNAQADLVDEFKREWETLRLSNVANAKEVAARRFPKGARMYESSGKTASDARKRFMYLNGKDSSEGYTRNGRIINLFYEDLTLPAFQQYQPEIASSLL